MDTNKHISNTPAHLVTSLSLLWATVSAVVFIALLAGREFLSESGFPFSFQNLFSVFGIITVAYFIFIPPIFIKPVDDEHPTSVWSIVAVFVVLALVSLPYFVMVRRIIFVEKIQLTAILSLALVCGLSSSFFYLLYPRIHFFFYSAIAFGFPLLYVIIAELWGIKALYIAGFSPFVSVYSLSPDAAHEKAGLGWGNTLLIFGLIAIVCLVYLILESRQEESE